MIGRKKKFESSPRDFGVGDLIMPRYGGAKVHGFGEIIADTTGLSSFEATELERGKFGVVIGTRIVKVAGFDRPMLDVAFVGGRVVGSMWPHDLDIVIQAPQCKQSPQVG